MRPPAVLLSTVYLAALAVALTAPAEHSVSGTVVLLALLARVLSRSPSARATLRRVARPHRLPDPVPTEVIAPA